MDSIEETKAFIEKLEQNELYKKSKSIHKVFQFRQFTDPVTGAYINGQQVRKEDASGISEGEEGFDSSTERFVIYNFKDGLLQSENDEPAVQFPGHWEMWDKGLLVKVVADGGDTEEYWKDGAPVSIETNLSARRERGENI